VKHLIIIADGAADVPMPQLGGQTAFEAARTPNLDALAKRARLGTAVTTPPGFNAGSDVCTMDLLGYDPRKYHTGRAPLEAAAIDVPMSDRDWVFRINLVTTGEEAGVDEGMMLDHSAGGIGDDEAKVLFTDLVKHWQNVMPAEARTIVLRHGVSYRASMVESSGKVFGEVTTVPPHEIPRQSWRANMPAARFSAASAPASLLNRLMLASRDVLSTHSVNAARRARDKRPGNMAWIWGQGTRPGMPSFESRFGLRGGMITAVDLLAGIAKLIGWERLDVPGVTSYHDTDYAAQGGEAIKALSRFDIVCCHVESPDEASHQADHVTKVAAIEAIDTHVAGPALAWLGDGVGKRVMVLPDHYTLVSTRKHDATPVPFLKAGDFPPGSPGKPGARFTEEQCKATGWVVAEGHELMDAFAARKSRT